MNVQEAKKILQDTRINWQIRWPADHSTKITFKDTDNEIIFADEQAFYRYRTHDNCSKCGSPINWEIKIEEISKEDLHEMVED
jgi:hypothetical protein